MAQRRLLFCLTLSLTHTSSDSLPYLLISDNNPKCVSVTASRETTLQVEFNAPGRLVTMCFYLYLYYYYCCSCCNKVDGVVAQLSPTISVCSQISILSLSLHYDSQYADMIVSSTNNDDDFAEPMDASKIQQRKPKDLSITIQQINNEQQNPFYSEWRQHRQLPSRGTGRIRREFNQKNGIITFDTGSMDGTVDICVQCLSASPTSPARLQLNITQQVTEQNETITHDISIAQAHLPRIQADLHGLDRKVQSIIANSDYAKDQEIQFHTISLRMNSASKYWPIIHVTVLFLAGFTQANHIVRFFKERHIS